MDVVVTDADGKLVTGLTAADFEIRERGRLQAVATFSEVSLPLMIRGPGAPLAAPGDIRSNTQDDGRLYVLILDDWHIDVELTTLVRETARVPRRYVRPGDLVAVVGPGARRDAARVHRRSRPRRRAIRLSPGGAATADHASPVTGRNNDRMAARQTSGFDDRGSDRGFGRRAHRPRPRVLRTLRRAADSLANVPGRRKTVIFFSGDRRSPEGRSRRERGHAGRAGGRRARQRRRLCVRSGGLGTSTRTASAAMGPRSAPRSWPTTGRASSRRRCCASSRSGPAARPRSTATTRDAARSCRPGEQPLLSARLHPDRRAAGRPVPFHRRARPAARPARRRAQGYVAPDDDRHAGKKRSEATGPLAESRSAGRCRPPVWRSPPRRSPVRRRRTTSRDRRDHEARSTGRRDRRNRPPWTSCPAGRDRAAADRGHRGQAGAAVRGRRGGGDRPRPDRAASHAGARRLPAPHRGARERRHGGRGHLRPDVPEPRRGPGHRRGVVGATHGGRLPRPSRRAADAGARRAAAEPARLRASDETLSAYAEVVDAGAGEPRHRADHDRPRRRGARAGPVPQPRANARAGRPAFAYAIDLPLKAWLPAATRCASRRGPLVRRTVPRSGVHGGAEPVSRADARRCHRRRRGRPAGAARRAAAAAADDAGAPGVRRSGDRRRRRHR